MLASTAPVTRCFGRSTNRLVIPGERSFQLPALMHDPRALSQGDARRWPAQDGCLVGRSRHRRLPSCHFGLLKRVDDGKLLLVGVL
jgi:hypothetical protein